MGRRLGLVGVLVPLVFALAVAAAGQGCVGTGPWANRETICIYGDADFTSKNGVIAGCGTPEDPYIIDGWRIAANGADFGINIERTTRIFVVRNCIIEAASGAAIRFFGVSGAAIEGCQLLRSTRGVLLENSRANGIIGNLIADNGLGVALGIGAKDNVVTANSFVSNGRSAQDSGTNAWSCGLIGNYWADYDGEDRNCDGIGDAPYWGPVADRYPLIASPWPCGIPPMAHTSSACIDQAPLPEPGPASGRPCTPDAPCAPETPPVVAPCSSAPCGPAPASAPSSPCASAACNPRVQACEDQVITCAKPVATLSAEFFSGGTSCGPAAVQWTKAGGAVVGDSPSISVTEPGTYTVTVTGADGCRASDVVTVGMDSQSPVVRATVAGELNCAVQCVELAAEVAAGRPPYTIEWTGPDGAVVGRAARVTASKPGPYTVRVVGVNGCSASTSVVVTQDVAPPAVTASVDQPLSCTVTQVTLSALVAGGNPPYTFEWTKPGGGTVARTPAAQVRSPGTYTVRVTGTNGCAATSAVVVTQDIEAPAVAVLADRTTLTCGVREIILTANISRGRVPYAISWTGPNGQFVGGTPVISADEPGTYAVTVTGANGCSSTASITVREDTELPMIDVGADQLLTAERDSVTLTATVTHCPDAYTVTWEDMLGNVVGDAESITVKKTGTYRATVVRTSTGCSASDEVVVNSTTVSEVLLDSDIEGLSVFGQLTLDGVPVPGSVFFLQVSAEQTGSQSALGAIVATTDLGGQSFEANGAEINYIIPGNAVVTFLINREQFITGKRYYLLHLPTDPPGEASVAFF